ncbi:LuxR C-terminal-related transcriptional regulator [Actinosynnema sp. NPDC050436]|uniref:response regulator transcription factor n=1 Tax=Actinosynnema sp. NPDC050436 TaxID=3155659 RepID=UPI0033C2DA93
MESAPGEGTALEARPPGVVVLTTYDSDANVVRGRGGRDRLPAQGSAAGRAGRRGPAGGARADRAVARRLLRTVRDPAPRAEVEILEHLARGLSNREVAKALFISQATVKAHLVRIFAELGAATRTAAVTTAVERRLVRLSRP